MTNSIAIFCGSALGSDQIFSETARQVGHTIAEQGKRHDDSEAFHEG